MGLEEAISLGLLAVKTVRQMIAEGRTKTTAEESAALKEAVAAADAADAEWDALPGGPGYKPPAGAK